MRITKKITIEQEVTEDILCNMCGKSCKESIFTTKDENYYGLIEKEITAGYDSKVFTDGDLYTFSLCEKCLKEIFDKFKINAYRGNLIYDDVDEAFILDKGSNEMQEIVEKVINLKGDKENV